MMRRTMMIGMMVLAAGCAAHEKPERPIPPPAAGVSRSEGEKSVFRAQAVQVTARVDAVDYKTRVVTLRGPEGNVFDVHCGPEVKNLAQVHVGDDVVTTYYESLAISAHKPGETQPLIETTVASSRAKPGETPGAADVQRTTVVATVVGINKHAGTVTVKGPRGKVVTVSAEDPKRLDQLAIGDHIELVYTEALAIGVEKAPGSEKSNGSHHHGGKKPSTT
jgi:hypothetical protein